MEKVELTEEQKLKILERFNDATKPIPGVRELTLFTFGQEYDARTKFGVAIRKLLEERGLEYKSAREWTPIKVIELTEEQKQFITTHLSTMKPLELGRVLFKNENLTNLDSEIREIYKYIKTLPINVTNKSVQKEELNVDNYNPPKTENQAIERINRFVQNANFIKDKLTEKQKRDIKNLIGYLHTTRLLSQINTYVAVIDRELFESEFIRCTYDKSLTEEEVDQYILYSKAVVAERQISKRIEMFEKQQDENIEGDRNLTMTLVEAVNTLRQDLNQCVTSQRALLKSLQGERKERLQNKGQNETVADILAYWASESKRKHLLERRTERRNQVKQEIERIKSMDDIKAEMFGVTEEELLG